MNSRLSLTLCVLLCSIGPLTAAIARPDAVDGKHYDLVVVGGTPGGIAMAVRAAREGLTVLLTNSNDHLGGILSSGLGVWDTVYEGKRSPIYDEARQAIFNHYRTTYGADSHQYRDALPGKSGHTNGKFEPRVAEKLFSEMVAREQRIAVLKGFVPAAVDRQGVLIRSITLRQTSGDKSFRVSAEVFADCTYEGDLAALAKVPYRVGRESRSDFNEPHAGKIYMHGSKPPTPEAAALVAEHDKLRLRKFTGWQAVVEPESTGQGDRNVQAFNYRTILSSDPNNRLPTEKPADYDPEYLKKLEFGSVVTPIPNRKLGWNRPQLVGPHQDYVEGAWETRRRVMDQHWKATMALLWFLQNDPSVPKDKRAYWQKYGLARDEFVDNGHRPYEFYVREARRIVGRSLFTEHDATLAPGLKRAPLRSDAIAITEWYLDTHACTSGKVRNSLDEGKMMLHHETFPGQVSYRCLLPEGVDNLLVPVCLSSTHVAWGTIRLEPTWMHIAESAAFGTVQAIKHGQTPAQIDTEKLLRTLCGKRIMLSFFNDVDVAGGETFVPAVQFFSTKGFFHDYNASPAAGLKLATGKVWAEGFQRLRAGQLDPNALARSVAQAESTDKDMTEAQFAALLPPAAKYAAMKSHTVITRGKALEWMFALLGSSDSVGK